MGIKKSFHRFKKNYIHESEALDNEEFVDVNLEGSTKTGIDWYNEYEELGGSKTQEDIVVNDLDVVSKNDWYHRDGSGQVFDNDGYEVDDWTPELEAFTYDEMVAELGTPEEAVKAEEQPGLSDEDYIDPETAIDSGYDEDFAGVDESCCGGSKKKGKKKGKKSKFVPFWAKKKLDEVSLGDGIHEGSGEWNYEDDIVKIDIYSNRCEGDEEEDIYLAKAEVLVEYKDPNYDFTSQREKFYDLAYNALRPDDGMDDSYFDGERTIGKFDFFFELDDDCEAIVAELTPIAQKVFISNVQEALKTLKKAGYKVINECGSKYCTQDLEDDATGFGIAFDDSDYYTEDGECEVCAICGQESCDGEYNEDGEFVCSDCAENSIERPMEDLDPMDIYFRAGRANNIRDMRPLTRSDDFDD